MNTPQIYALIQGAIVFLAGMAASRGWISHETVVWLGGPETLGVIGTVCGAVVILITWYKTRTKGVVGTAGNLLQGRGVIVAPPAIANSSATPDNVVSSLQAAQRIPGVAKV